MILTRRLLIVASLLAVVPAPAADDEQQPESFSVLSWNVSDDAFVREPDVFAKTLAWANADVLVLDEVHPTADIDVLRKQLPSPDGWHVHVGESGGRQRQVIASRDALTPLAEFAGEIRYPAADRDRLWQAMSSWDRSNPDWTMDNGIPVTGAIVEGSQQRLLVIATDLQCCGDTPQSWQEQRRRVEARVVRDLIRSVLQRERVDAMIIAGDLNLVNGPFALSILGGHYAAPIYGVVPAEAYHAHRSSTWTWDGRNTPFPNGTLDFQLFSPGALKATVAGILDTEEMHQETLARLELDADSMAKTGRHRPLLVTYEWLPTATGN